MITILSFIISVVLIYSLNLVFGLANFPFWYITVCVASGIIAVIIIDALCATICAKLLPDKWFTHDKKFFNVPKLESRFYNFIKVKKWKNHILELGDFNGFSKKQVAENTSTFFEKFIVESNKGFIGHLISILLGFVIIIVFPIEFKLSIALPIAISNALINYLSLSILRYNYPKLQAGYRFSIRKETENTNNEEKKD